MPCSHALRRAGIHILQRRRIQPYSQALVANPRDMLFDIRCLESRRMWWKIGNLWRYKAWSSDVPNIQRIVLSSRVVVVHSCVA